MKKILCKLKEHILLDTIFYILFIIIVYFILKLFNMRYRNWIYYISYALIIIGTIAGIIQLYRRKGKTFKKSIIVLTFIVVLIILVFWKYILFVLALLYTPEHVVIKDDEKYVAHVHSWHDTTVEYYEYVNLFFMGNKKAMKEHYYNIGRDVLDKEIAGKYTPSKTIYYEKNGKTIMENNIINYIDKEDEGINTEQPETDNYNENVISWEFDNNIKVKIVNHGSWSGKDILTIEKSIDGGLNYEIQNASGFDAHYGWSAVFISPNIGFINDPGIPGNGENWGLYVTIDGGKTFELANIIHPVQIEEESLFVDGVPYYEDNELLLKIYTINHSKVPEKTYYEFYSNDNGKTWLQE